MVMAAPSKTKTRRALSCEWVVQPVCAVGSQSSDFPYICCGAVSVHLELVDIEDHTVPD